MLDSQLKKQAQLRETILAAIGMLLLCYALYVNIYSPKKDENSLLKFQLTELGEKMAGIEKLNIALQKKYESQNQELKKQARLAAIQNPKAQMIRNSKESRFKDVNEFLNAVTQPTFRSTVNINNLKYNLPMKKSGYRQTGFELNAFGRFEKVIEFIEKLEAIPALVSIDSINLQTKKNDTNTVTLDIEGTFYILEN